MKPGSLGTTFPDRPSPLALFHQRTRELEQGMKAGTNFGPGAPRMFSNAGQEYCEKYSADIVHFAKIGKLVHSSLSLVRSHAFIPAAKNHAHSKNNPYSQFRNGWTVQQVLHSPKITNQLTKFMCSPTSVSDCIISVPISLIHVLCQDGASCCVVASEAFVHAHNLENQAIEIVALELETDHPVSLESNSAMEVVGYSMTKRCADKVFAEAGFAPGKGRDEVGVIELHDCFAANEVCACECLRFDQYLSLLYLAHHVSGAWFVCPRCCSQDGR